jgi:transposase
MLPFFAKLPPCLVGIEACNNSHYWARELTALGHDVRHASAVRKALREAREERCCRCRGIREAVTRPTMRFVAVKSPEQQSLMMLHRVRLASGA